MEKIILINSTHKEETRVAVIQEKALFDFDLQSNIRESKKANIYKAEIARLEPSLNAVFVTYGSSRQGFLPIKEIAPIYFKSAKNHYEAMEDITKQLTVGQELIIQVNKEERGHKGAAVSTQISLAGCYLVLMPQSKKSGGISRRVVGDERQQLRAALDELEVPEGVSVIARTAAVGRAAEELQWDLNCLLKLWDAVQKAADANKPPFLIYRESDVIMRTIRDYLRHDISAVVVDTKASYDQVMEHVERLRPDFKDRVKLYQGDKPLFIEHNIESQIETAFSREVTLPSGGAIVIDHTEALISIDINSAKATRGKHIEETALATNLEAADEIGKQLRLRDIGGLIVIDFIDMENNKNQRQVEGRLQEALKADRARIQVNRISRLGLLEMSRQRLRPALGEMSNIVCPRCAGAGTVRSVESLSLSIIRSIVHKAVTGNYEEIHLLAPNTVAAFIINEKRDVLQSLEVDNNVRIIVLPCPFMETPHFEILCHEESNKTGKRSYKMHDHIMKEQQLANAPKYADQVEPEQAAIQHVPTDSAPVIKKAGIIQGMFQSLFGSSATNDTVAPTKTANKRSTSQTGARQSTSAQKSTSTTGSGSQQRRRNPNRTSGSGQRQGSGQTGGQRGNQPRGQQRQSNANRRGQGPKKPQVQDQAVEQTQAETKEQANTAKPEVKAKGQATKAQSQGQSQSQSQSKRQTQQRDQSKDKDDSQVAKTTAAKSSSTPKTQSESIPKAVKDTAPKDQAPEQSKSQPQKTQPQKTQAKPVSDKSAKPKEDKPTDKVVKPESKISDEVKAILAKDKTVSKSQQVGTKASAPKPTSSKIEIEEKVSKANKAAVKPASEAERPKLKQVESKSAKPKKTQTQSKSESK